jgi:amino acid transporter
MKHSNYDMGRLVMGFYGGLWAYSGWDILNYGAGEITNPRRNVPAALLSGIAVVTLVYVCLNISFFAVLDVETMKSSNAVAALFSQRTMGKFSVAIPFLIGVLLIGSLNSNLFSGSRYMYAAAKQGHLPSCFSCVNFATDSPRVAIVAQSALAMGISFIGDLDALIGYVMFGFWAQRIFTLIALLTIRYKGIPVHPEAVRVPISIIYLFLIINIVLVVIPIFQEFAVTSLGIFICCIGFAFYFLFVYPKTSIPILSYLNDISTFIASIIFDALPDVKTNPLGIPVPPVLVASDSQQQLLNGKRSSFSLTSVNSSVTDLHSDEKNTMIRNGSATGLRLW